MIFQTLLYLVLIAIGVKEIKLMMSIVGIECNGNTMRWRNG